MTRAAVPVKLAYDDDVDVAGRVAWLLGAALWALAAAVIAGAVTLAALHLRDDYHVGHLQGVWVAVSDAARSGELYPPLFDGERYAGTRYLPLPILVNAAAAAAAGDPLVGGKAAAAVLTCLLLIAMVAALRALSCPWPTAAALAAVVVATDTGLRAATTIGGDMLPAALQTGALAIALRGRRAAWLAGLAAGLAVASKLTGFWALAAIGVWYFARRERRAVLAFAAAAIAAAVLVLGAVQIASGGGLLQHVIAFSTAGVGGIASLARAPNQLLYNLLGHASGTVVLMPLALFGAALAIGQRPVPLVYLAWGLSILLLLVVYADIGTGANQLLDLVVLTSLSVGHLAGRASFRASLLQPLAALVSLAVLWAGGLDLVRTVVFDLRTSIAEARAGSPPARAALEVARLVRPGERVLAEDPSIHVALGERPLLMDPFMVRRLERLAPRDVDVLVARIEQREFDLVVLVVSLENRDVDFWWRDFHFGERVAEALRRGYRFERRLGRYALYRPRT